MPHGFEEDSRRVDGALTQWRQGDCMLGDEWFLHRFEPDAPLTPEAREVAVGGAYLCETPVRGLMLATQTCDIVRPSRTRPFVEVTPLVKVDDHILREVEFGRRPGYAFIPGTVGERLVADLDRVMTVEKAVVVTWKRREGCGSDEDRRRLASSLARKRARVAFPEDFTRLADGLKNRLVEKHGRQTDEGRALRALREIRVRAAPSWGAPEVELLFWFIRDEDSDHLLGRPWPDMIEAWLRLVPAAGRFVLVEGIVATLADLSARDYVESDRLDLDHLS